MSEHRPSPPATYTHVTDRLAAVVSAYAQVAASATETAATAAQALVDQRGDNGPERGEQAGNDGDQEVPLPVEGVTA